MPGLAISNSLIPLRKVGLPGINGPVDLTDLNLFFASFDANASGNTTNTVSQTFTSGNVDVAGNRLTGLTLPFTDQVEGTSCYQTPVTLTTSGVLPGGLSLNTQYFIEPVTGGHRFYKVSSNKDWADVQGGLTTDDIAMGQYAAQNRGAVTLTDTGSGTHTINTLPLLAKLKDLTPNGFDIQNTTSTAYGELFEVISNATYGKFIKSYGCTQHHSDYGVVKTYGKRTDMVTGTVIRDALRSKMASQQFVGSVNAIVPKRTLHGRMTLQARFTNAQLTIGTGVFAKSNATSFVTGDLVTIAPATSGTTLPTPNTGLITDDFYVRAISSTSCSLHPTATDATNNTNVITFSSAGSGTFFLVAARRVHPQQQSYYAFNLDRPDLNNGHYANLAFFPGCGNYGLKKAQILSGQNGRINCFSFVRDVAAVMPWAPSRATLPTTSDRSQPLNSLDQVTGVSLTNPVVVTLSTTPKLATGDTGFFYNLGGTTDLNETQAMVTVSGNTYILNGVDGTNFKPFTSGGVVTPVYWTSRSSVPGGVYTRLHRTKAQAQSMSGVADGSVGSNCVLFTNYGTSIPEMDAKDEFNLMYTDSVSMRVGHNNLMPNSNVPYDKTVVIATKMDCTPTYGTFTPTYQENNFAPANINTGTGLVSKFQVFATGDAICCVANASSTIPTGFANGVNTTPKVMYLRSVSAFNTFTCHPTLADANANTNIIIPSDAGTGTFNFVKMNAVGSLSINGGAWEKWPDTFEKWGILGSTVSSSLCPLMLGNAAEPHTPGAWEYSAFALAAGSDESTFDSQISTAVSRYKAQHSIA